MKTILALLFALGASLANAVTFPNSLPIRDKASLLAYAMERVTHGSVSVHGLTVHQTNDTYRLAYGNDDVVIKELWNRPFNISVTNPEDAVYYWITLMDEDWSNSFYAHVAVQPQKVNGVWTLATARVDLHHNDSVTIETDPDIDGAYVILRGENGSIEYIYLDVYDGAIYFPVWYAGMEGEIILTGWSNGNRYSQGYRLDGELIPNTNLAGGLRIGVKNAFFYSDQFAPTSPISTTGFFVDVYGNADRYPCVMKVKTTSPKTLNVFGYLWDHVENDVIYPRKAYIRQRGESGVTEVILYGDRYTPVLLPTAGEYYITFPDFEEALSQPNPPNSSKG